jgi:hypothetical protein
MLSVIIPTIWKSPYVLDLLNYLENTDTIKEVILIDNDISKTGDLSNLKKIKYIQNKQNNYVNPSWNQGVSVATCDNLCVMNDDLIVPKKVFELCDSFLTPDINMIGLSPSVYDNIYDDIAYIKEPEHITLSFTPKRFFGYGCCFFIHKSNWMELPEDMMIQYGDDYIFYSSTKKNYVVSSFKIVGKISASMLDENLKIVNKEVIGKICQSDHSIFWDHIIKNVIDREPIDKWDDLKLEELKKYKTKSMGNLYF